MMLPKLDGLEVCKRLRAESSVPIIMLTARDDELDKVLGLELGADDYITKPFSIREFRSRVRALLRRAASPGGTSEDGEVIAADGLAIDLAPARRSRCGGEPVQLTYVEFELLRTSPRSPGRVFTRQDAARGALGRLRLPRAAHDRRPRPPPAREARARPARAASTSSPCAASATASATREPASAASARGSASALAARRRGRARRRLPDRRPVARAAPRSTRELAQLDEAAPAIGSQLREQPRTPLADDVDRRPPRQSANARVVLLQPSSAARRLCVVRGLATPVTLAPTSQDDPVAHTCVRPKRRARAAPSRRRGERYAEAAVPGPRRQLRSLLAARLARTTRSRASTSCGAGSCSPRAVALLRRAPARLRRRVAVRAPDPAARARGRPDRERALRRAGRRPGADELGAAGARRSSGCAQRLAQLDARAPGVHRQRLARAAHAALLARRLPRAARRRGARRGHAARVPGDDARAGRPADEARHRPARPLAARRRAG